MSAQRAPAGGAAASPMSAVRAAIAGGAASASAIAEETGLSTEFAAAVVTHLVRMGALTAETVHFSCPPTGCGGCKVAVSGRCEPVPASDMTRRPALVLLSMRAEDSPTSR